MNAMAAHGAVARQPEFVVINDGTAVENIGTKNVIAKLAKFGAIALIPLGLGVAVGQISMSAKHYNRTITDAGRIHADVTAIGSGLTSVQQALERGREHTGGTGYALNDNGLTEELAQLKLVEPNLEVVYGSSLFDFPHELVKDVITFYQDMLALNAEIKDHVEKARSSSKAIQEGQARWGTTLAGIGGFAGLIELPSGEDSSKAKGLPRLRLVQVGKPVCGGGQCPDGTPPDELQFRVSELGNWGTKKVATISGETVKGNSLIPINPDTKVFEHLVKGGQSSLAEEAYQKRLATLEERVTRLLELRDSVLQRLNARKNESQKFSFFL
jgi:hypothetical protein